MDSRTYRVRHVTSYSYLAAVTDGFSVTCLTPRDTDRQSVVTAAVSVDPPETERDTISDVFGNQIDQFGIHYPHQRLDVIAESTVRVNLIERPVDPSSWEEVVAAIRRLNDEHAFIVRFLTGVSPMVPHLEHPMIDELVGSAFAPNRPIIEALEALNAGIFQRFEFDSHFSNVSTPLADVLDARRGVCQDFAHLAAACARRVGLSARYMSGYIETVPADGQPRLVGADASHAWCSVWTPHAGWVDFDPTNDHLPVNDHITVGWGRDYGDVTPVRGIMIGPPTSQNLEVSVDVERI